MLPAAMAVNTPEELIVAEPPPVAALVAVMLYVVVFAPLIKLVGVMERVVTMVSVSPTFVVLNAVMISDCDVR